MATHLTFGGSTATRTLNCPAWAELSKDLPPEPASYSARLGTVLHDILEQCLDQDADPISFVEQTIDGIPITLDLIQRKIDPALDAIAELMDEYGITDFWCETFTQIREDVGGTADIVGLNEDGSLLMVADYKSGDGYLVDAENNDQLRFYAMCLMHDPRYAPYTSNVDTILYAIIQPTERREQVIDLITESPSVIRDRFYPDFMLALDNQDVTAPNEGDHCQFCPAMAVCPLKRAAVVHSQTLDLDKLGDDLGAALDMAGSIERWLKAVRKMAYERLERDEPVRGWKLINKRAQRAWNDEDAVIEHIKKMRSIKIDDATTYTLKSPAQLEKVFKDANQPFKQLRQYITQNSSGLTLARNDDPREPVNSLESNLKQISNR